jgi:hypothetical protein
MTFVVAGMMSVALGMTRVVAGMMTVVLGMTLVLSGVGSLFAQGISSYSRLQILAQPRRVIDGGMNIAPRDRIANAEQSESSRTIHRRLRLPGKQRM